MKKLLQLGQELPNLLVKTGRIVGNHRLRGINAVGEKNVNECDQRSLKCLEK